MHLTWRLSDFFDEYDPAAAEPAPPPAKDADDDDEDSH
jgi:hypothetical protein